MKRLFVLLLLLSSLALAGRHGGASHHGGGGGRHYSTSSSHPHRSAHSGGRAHTSTGTRSVHHRDSGYRVKRDVSQATKNKLFKQAGIPKSERKNYVIDHKVALENGGTNDISNLQVQSKSAAKAKDKLENREAAARRHSQGLTKSKHKKH